MRDQIVWRPIKMPTDLHGVRTVYVKHYFVPFVGFMSAADTAFSIPAYVRVKGKRLTGYVTPSDDHAFTQEHGALEFRTHNRHKP